MLLVVNLRVDISWILKNFTKNHPQMITFIDEVAAVSYHVQGIQRKRVAILFQVCYQIPITKIKRTRWRCYKKLIFRMLLFFYLKYLNHFLKAICLAFEVGFVLCLKNESPSFVIKMLFTQKIGYCTGENNHNKKLKRLSY